jgi:hypothetical protein
MTRKGPFRELLSVRVQGGEELKTGTLLVTNRDAHIYDELPGLGVPVDDGTLLVYLGSGYKKHYGQFYWVLSSTGVFGCVLYFVASKVK